MNTTGNATLTPGAYYGPIQEGFNLYTQCSYVNTDDGWDVMVPTTVKYFDKTTGQVSQYSDACVGGGNTVAELDCEFGYRKVRNVKCPSETRCVDGACVE